LSPRACPLKDAAARLGVSPRTVQNHIHNVLGKLRLRNRVELARYAVREGYEVDDPPAAGKPRYPDQR